MHPKCEKCFWNYNCPMTTGEDLDDFDYAYIKECERYQE